MKTYTCGVCGTEHVNVNDYAICVSKCVEELKQKQEAEKKRKRLEEVNAALNKLKAAKAYYEEQLDIFKEKYPEEYKLNFGAIDTEEDVNLKKKESKRSTISIGDSVKNKPINRVIINGKDATPETLFTEDDWEYFAKLFKLT